MKAHVLTRHHILCPRTFLVFGALWIVLDISLNILRLLSLQLLDDNTFIQSLLIPINRPLNRWE